MNQKYLSSQISQIPKFFKQLISDYDYAFEQVRLKDKEKCDIEHELELSDMSYRESCKWGTKLRNVLKERRKVKDTVELLEDIHGFMDSKEGQSMIRSLEVLLGKVRKVEERLQNRVYHARVRDDISIAQPPAIDKLIGEYKKEYKERRR